MDTPDRACNRLANEYGWNRSTSSAVMYEPIPVLRRNSKPVASTAYTRPALTRIVSSSDLTEVSAMVSVTELRSERCTSRVSGTKPNARTSSVCDPPGSESSTTVPFWSPTANRWPTTHARAPGIGLPEPSVDRKSTRLKSSHAKISYAVFCLKKKKKERIKQKKTKHQHANTSAICCP